MNKYKLADKINREVNSSIKYKDDLSHYGVSEKWTFPTDGYGDCEDYALLKRAMLLEGGFGSEDLMLAICKTENMEGHAVLFVNTEEGGYILDNRYSDLQIPSKLTYTEWQICRGGEWFYVNGWR